MLYKSVIKIFIIIGARVGSIEFLFVFKRKTGRNYCEIVVSKQASEPMQII